MGVTARGRRFESQRQGKKKPGHMQSTRPEEFGSYNFIELYRGRPVCSICRTSGSSDVKVFELNGSGSIRSSMEKAI